ELPSQGVRIFLDAVGLLDVVPEVVLERQTFQAAIEAVVVGEPAPIAAVVPSDQALLGNVPELVLDVGPDDLKDIACRKVDPLTESTSHGTPSSIAKSLPSSRRCSHEPGGGTSGPRCG